MIMELPHIWHPASRLDMSQSLGDWFNGSLGQDVLSAEQRLLSHILPDLFGYHALQIGQVVPCNLLHSSRIRHRIVTGQDLQPVEGLSLLPAMPHHLPLANDSIDVVVLHHLLDVVASPHAVLREAARVLLPEGHLVIMGFNPWSLWGLWRFCRLPWSDTPWLQRVLTPQRLADWLSLLDFDVVGVESAFFLPPLATDMLRQRFSWLNILGQRYWSQGGAAYAILAQKRVACMTPLQLRQPILQMLRPALLAETRDNNGQLKEQD